MSSVSWHPYIVEDEEFKLLQFAEWDIQSKMRKAAPNELVLSYTQAMMAFMLFVEAPRDVLIVGLGGGSLSKFCHAHLPSARITTIEISQEVIDLRNDFCIPEDGARFRVIHADVAAWLEGKEKIADVILLDGYDAHGIPSALCGLAFYRRCKAALTDSGMLVVNINLGSTNHTDDERCLQVLFEGRAVSIRSAAGFNDILLGFAGPELPAVAELKRRAIALREQTGLDFPLLLDKVRSAAGEWP